MGFVTELLDDFLEGCAPSCYESLDARRDFCIDHCYVGENNELVMTSQEVKWVLEVIWGYFFMCGIG